LNIDLKYIFQCRPVKLLIFFELDSTSGSTNGNKICKYYLPSHLLSSWTYCNFFFLDKMVFINKIDSLYFHGSLQCVVIQKFSLDVVQSSKFIQVLILTKNHHFSKLVLIYGITTMKSTYHSHGSFSYSVIQNLVHNFRCSANVCSSLRFDDQVKETPYL